MKNYDRIKYFSWTFPKPNDNWYNDKEDEGDEAMNIIRNF